MNINRVQYGDRTLIDLTMDNVSPDTLAEGVQAHDSSGRVIHGRAKLFTSVLNDVYPIGSVYQSFSQTSPAKIFGGSWERLEGQFLLAASSEYPVQSTGGEATHKLTIAETPAHVPEIRVDRKNGEPGGYAQQWDCYINQDAWDQVTTPGGEGGYMELRMGPSVGGGASHNNMPPYRAVNIWIRVS